MAANARAANAIIVTNLAACVGGHAWTIVEIIHKRKMRMRLSGFCMGAVAGLVCVTPASGFISSHFATFFGIARKYRENNFH